jgi:hypothetical protein
MKKRNKVDRSKLTRVSINLNGEFVTNNPLKVKQKLHKWLEKHGVARANIHITYSDRLDTGKGVPGVNWFLYPTIRQQAIIEKKKERQLYDSASQVAEDLVNLGYREGIKNGQQEPKQEVAHADHD